MTAHLFDQCLAWFNRTVIDNCPAHKTLIEYLQVKVVVLPANKTSKCNLATRGLFERSALAAKRCGQEGLARFIGILGKQILLTLSAEMRLLDLLSIY
jgi:hypothetical protein